MQIIKRDGRKKELDIFRIHTAIHKAYLDVSDEETFQQEYNFLEPMIVEDINKIHKEEIDIEQVQNLIIKNLKKINKTVAKSYKQYRDKRTQERDKKSDLMSKIHAVGIETDRDNANVGNNFSSKLLRIASESNKWHILSQMPIELSQEHLNGDLYYHDLDSYNLTVNCLHIPTGEVLKRGFNTGYGTINTPNGIETAGELSCILLQSTQNDMFGGQSHPNFDNDLGQFVQPTREKVKKEVYEIWNMQKYNNIDEKDLQKEIEGRVEKRVRQAMQGIVYNLNTMHSRAGSQVPFSSVNIGLPKNKDEALVCQLFLEEYEKGLGKGEQPIFPNIIFRVKSGVNREENDPYFYLYKLACRVASKRMNPTFMNIDADFNKEYYEQGYVPATMGCRTYIMSNINGEAGVEGRGNIAPTTINFPRLGIKSMNIENEKERIEYFFKILDEKINLAKDSLLHRYDVLKKLKIKDLPFVAGQELMKGSEGLTQDDSIEPILKQGSWGIGFIGIAETLVALKGKHHGESEEAKELGIRIIQHLRDKCDEFKEQYKLNFSCYATPAEGLSSKFTDKDKEQYGIIEGVTDKEYYTNSFHIPVNYKLSIIEKIQIEAPYHKLCNGGHISYVEVDNYPNGQQIMDIINYAYNNTNISYMGINFHIRYCRDCGTHLQGNQHTCTNCGSENIQGISRVTGYLSLDERFGIGKSAEREDRTSSNGNKFYNK